MINVIIEEDLYDHDFVRELVLRLRRAGRGACREYPLERGRGDHVGAGRHHRAPPRAPCATNHPSSLHVGPGHRHERQTACRPATACSSWPPFCGNLDVPGGVTLAVPASASWGKWRYECAQQLPPGNDGEADHRPGALPRLPAPAHVIAHPDCILDTLETNEALPLEDGLVLCHQRHSQHHQRARQALVQGASMKTGVQRLPGRAS